MINIKRILITGDMAVENKGRVDEIRQILSEILQVEHHSINCTYEEVPDEEKTTETLQPCLG